MNLAISAFVLRPHPSARFAPMEIAALRNWDVRP